MNHFELTKNIELLPRYSLRGISLKFEENKELMITMMYLDGYRSDCSNNCYGLPLIIR